RSSFLFTVADERTIHYGLGAIKGVGESAIEGIVEAREREGAYADLFDFCRRIDLRKCNRRVLESLIRAGALDAFGSNRATLMVQLPLALKMAEQHHAQQAAGQSDLFGLSEPQAAPSLGIIPDEVPEWSDEQRLRGEKETLGLFLTGHPIDAYEREIEALLGSRLGTLSLDNGGPGYARKGKEVTVAGLVMTINKRNTQRGMMASVLLDDKSGRIEATFFSEAYERSHSLLRVDQVVVIQGTLVHDDYRDHLGIRADGIWTFEQYRADRLNALELIDGTKILRERGWGVPEFREQLPELLRPWCGGEVPVYIRYQRDDAQAMVRLGEAWKIAPTDELLAALRRVFGRDCLRFKVGVQAASPMTARGSAAG
ncbi:MAG TPA: DNA polymerase III subunit alpha, partial [Chromatiaceae bacterium]|nr:DNA polymerase III subunit alpha [Chromatiaceae bacterium]